MSEYVLWVSLGALLISTVNLVWTMSNKGQEKCLVFEQSRLEMRTKLLEIAFRIISASRYLEKTGSPLTSGKEVDRMVELVRGLSDARNMMSKLYVPVLFPISLIGSEFEQLRASIKEIEALVARVDECLSHPSKVEEIPLLLTAIELELYGRGESPGLVQ
jgi:hypothetical protein